MHIAKSQVKEKRLFKDAVINIAVEEKASAAAAVYYSVSSVHMWTKSRFRFLFKQRSLPKFAGKNSTGTQCDLSAGTTHLLQIMRLIIYSTEMICPALTSAAERVEDVNSGGHWIMIPRGTGEFTVKKRKKDSISGVKSAGFSWAKEGERFLNVT